MLPAPESQHQALATFSLPPRFEPLPDRRWQIGAVAGPVWQWQKVVLHPPDHLGHTAFAERSEGPATGWQSGLAAKVALTPHWRISAGLERRITTQVSAHSATLRLMDGICLNPYDLGPKEYEFQYGLLSGSSESQLTIRIAQVDSVSTMPVDEPFLLTMRTARQRTDWVLPLTVQRTFGRGRWQGFVQGGGAVNMPGKIAVQVEHFSEACSDLCFATDHGPTLSQERGTITLSWLFGAGLDYRLNRRWSLMTAPTLFGQKGQFGLVLNSGIQLKF